MYTNTESLCWPPETDIRLQSNLTSIKKNAQEKKK